MATGAPDWQSLRWKVEATIRPSLIHPGGKVVFVDQFETPTLRWRTATQNGATVALQTSEAFAGDAGLKMSTAAQANSQAVVVKTIGLPTSTKVGLETRFVMPTTTDGEMRLILEYYDGTTRHQARVQWDDDGDKWRYLNSSDVLTDVTEGTQALFRTQTTWNNAKLVADFDSDEFLWLKSNNLLFNLKDIGIRTSASTTDPRLEATIVFHSTTATETDSYYDHVIITEE